MKTTLDIHDDLMRRAKALARRTGRPLRAVVEEGLRRLLDAEASQERYILPDRSVGDPSHQDPTERLSWQDLRELVYDDRDVHDRD